MDVVSGLFDYMRNEYRNPRQIKTDGGKLADYTLLLFEEKVKAIFNKAVRSDLIASNPIHDLTKGERFHAPESTVSSSLPKNLPASSAWRQPPIMSGRCSYIDELAA